MTSDEVIKFIKESIDRNYSNDVRRGSRYKGTKFIETPYNNIIKGFTIDYDKSMITHVHLRGEVRQITIEGTLSYESI